MVLKSVADPDPGPFWAQDPGSGMGKNQDQGPIRDEQPGSYFRELKKQFFGLKYWNSFMWIPSGIEKIRIMDPGWKKVGSGIWDKHPGSATLVFL
jgi:hypothetical protein